MAVTESIFYLGKPYEGKLHVRFREGVHSELRDNFKEVAMSPTRRAADKMVNLKGEQKKVLPKGVKFIGIFNKWFGGFLNFLYSIIMLFALYFPKFLPDEIEQMQLLDFIR